ncbi:Uncharacterised protein [Mycobacteroides abscessus subsp. abscessus]|nr:Uncharacterised protein [Mycobacteroides abscessus subsp. abscessus]
MPLRCGEVWLTITLPTPRCRATSSAISPMGPAPQTSRVSSLLRVRGRSPRTTAAIGSTRDATAMSRPSGTTMTLPAATPAAGMSTCSAKPPSKVSPTDW